MYTGFHISNADKAKCLFLLLSGHLKEECRMKLFRRIPVFIAAGGLVLASLVTAVALLAGNVSSVHATSSFPRKYPRKYSVPYQGVTIGASLQSATLSLRAA
jgi:hypothetical protein